MLHAVIQQLSKQGGMCQHGQGPCANFTFCLRLDLTCVGNNSQIVLTLWNLLTRTICLLQVLCAHYN